MDRTRAGQPAMKCPKCQYISFDSTERCRNCGYEFAFTPETPSLDLPIQTGDEALGPLEDFPMDDRFWDAPELEPDAPPAAAGPPVPPAARGEKPPRPITSVFDLPLFKDRPIDDDTPLVAPSAVPRQPLSVRRSSPVPRTARSAADESTLDLDALEPEVAPLRHSPWLPKTELRVRSRGDAAPEARIILAAGVIPRIIAGIVDAFILVFVCSVVLYITLQVCGLRVDQMRALPIPPLAGFLLLLTGGYFVLLTAAGGQTIGKMAAGIRVVPMGGGERVTLGHSTMRAVGYLVSLLPAGLGLVPALIHADRRTLHDRLAETRVVKA
jgi:uncharacterized RDD family membrane protein YckC